MHVPVLISRQRLFPAALTALLLASPGPVHADDKPSPAGGFFGTFEGHYLKNIGEKTRWGMTVVADSISTANYNVLPEWGGGGRVGLGYRSSAGWDLVALGDADWLYSGEPHAVVTRGLFTNTLIPRPAPGSIPAAEILPSPSQTTADAQLAYSYVDLEGGYNLKLGEIFDARLFGGVRYANFDQDIDTSGATLGNFFPLSSGVQEDGRQEVSYWGVGPRIGASGRLRICQSPFYLVSSVSGAVLFGDMRVREKQSVSFGPALNLLNTESTNYTSRTAYNGEGEMGVLYDISPVLQGLDVTVGYRLAGWFGVNDTRTTTPSFPSGESHANVVTQGTFLRINVRY
jgi:hypothetical protein